MIDYVGGDSRAQNRIAAVAAAVSCVALVVGIAFPPPVASTRHRRAHYESLQASFHRSPRSRSFVCTVTASAALPIFAGPFLAVVIGICFALQTARSRQCSTYAIVGGVLLGVVALTVASAAITFALGDRSTPGACVI